VKKKIAAEKTKGKRKLGRTSRRWDVNIRIDLTLKIMRDLGLGLFDSVRGSVKGCCRKCSNSAGLTKGGEFFK